MSGPYDIDEEEKTPGSYDKDDAAEDTDSSISDVSEAWHSARDDADESGDISRGSGPGESDPGEATEAYSLESLRDIAFDRDDSDDNDDS